MIEETLASLARSVCVAFTAVGFGRLTSPLLTSPAIAPSVKRTLFVLCALPVFAPTLLTGYAYARWSLPLVHLPLAKEASYLLLLALRFAPLGVLLYWIFPPSLCDSGRHCLQLAKASSGLRIPLRVRLRAFADTPGIVFLATALLAFHEFEIASLTGVETWSVRLFDAHAGGIPWGEAMAAASAPIAVQLGLAALCVWALRRQLFATGAEGCTRKPTAGRCAAASGVTLLSACGIVVLPMGLIAAEASAGMSQLYSSFAMQKEILASLIFGLSGGALAFVVSSAVPMRCLGLLAIPGLCGSLILALSAVRIFQWDALRAVYDSPLPLIGVIVLLLLPVAFLLKVLRSKLAANGASHVASLAQNWSPRWRMTGRGAFGSIAILCLLAYVELTASAILAPPGMTTAPARLYNLMHYGQTEVLSAMVMVVFLVPVAMVALLWTGIEAVVYGQGRRG
jgi:ABC-type Fe3+ transport system permease subunit